MSKTIWHTSNEKPEQLRYYLEEYDKFSDRVGYLANKRYGVVNTIDDLTTKRWCYVDDLLALETENKDLSDKIGKLETELERTRKALDYAIDVIQTVAKMSDKLSKEYGETLVEQLDNIQAYCWQEGYVLTHEEDLSKALEQKGAK